MCIYSGKFFIFHIIYYVFSCCLKTPSPLRPAPRFLFPVFFFLFSFLWCLFFTLPSTWALFYFILFIHLFYFPCRYKYNSIVQYFISSWSESTHHTGAGRGGAGRGEGGAHGRVTLQQYNKLARSLAPAAMAGAVCERERERERERDKR